MNKVGNIVVTARHQMASAQVQPLQLREPTGKLRLNMHKGTLQDVGSALAVAVAVKALDVVGQLQGELVGRDAKPGAGGTGVVQSGAYLGILRIDAQADGDALPHHTVETLVLRKGVEGKVRGTADDVVELRVGVGRRIGVRPFPKLFESQACLAERACRRGAYVLPEDGESLPQGEGLEGQNDFHVGLPGYVGYQLQVPAQPCLLYNINRCIRCHWLNFSAKIRNN